MKKKFSVFCIVLFAFFTIEVFADFDKEIQREFIILFDHKNADLNPHTASYSIEAQIINGLYEGLFICDASSLEPVPGICQSFKQSRDKKKWTFYLRENAKFSDGQIITAQDVKNSWIKLLSNPNAPYASLFDIVAGAKDFREGKTRSIDSFRVSVIDDRTLSIKLENPAEHLLNILSLPAFAVVSPNADVYSGAFVLTENSENQIILTKNENYWDTENVALPSIKFLQSDNYEENTYNYNMEKIDWALGGVDFDKILNSQSIFLTTQFGTEYFFFKPQKEPWNNPTLRRALLTAIPWDELQKNSIVKTVTFIVPVMGYPEIYGVPEYDLEEALDLKKEAGFENQELSLTIGIEDSDYVMELASILKNAWEEIGVNLNIETTSNEKYLNSIKNWDADLFTYSWLGDFADPISFLELFRGDSSMNVSGWKNAEYDKILEESASMESYERLRKLSEAEQLLLDDGMIIPISHSIAFNVVNTEYIKGWYENVLNYHPLKNIYFVEKPLLPNIVKLY